MDVSGPSPVGWADGSTNESRGDASTSTSYSVLHPNGEAQSPGGVEEERARLERKIEKLREKITRKSIARESDVQEYLRVASNIEQRNKDRPVSDNPQMARIKHHFEVSRIIYFSSRLINPI